MVVFERRSSCGQSHPEPGVGVAGPRTYQNQEDRYQVVELLADQNRGAIAPEESHQHRHDENRLPHQKHPEGRKSPCIKHKHLSCLYATPTFKAAHFKGIIHVLHPKGVNGFGWWKLRKVFVRRAPSARSLPDVQPLPGSLNLMRTMRQANQSPSLPCFYEGILWPLHLRGSRRRGHNI